MNKHPAYLWPASTECYDAAEVDGRIAEHAKDWEDAAKERVRHLARIAELAKALGNCRLLAIKRLHKGAVEKADWEAILRFCTEAGCGPSPLRADS